MATSNSKTNVAEYNIPYDLDAEMALLGSIIISGKYATELVDEIGDKLKPEFFYNPKNRRVYSAILKLWLNQSPIDTIHLLDIFKKDESKSLIDVIDQDYMQQLIAKSSLLSNPAEYILREVISIGEEMKILGLKQDLTAESILDSAQGKLFKVTLGNVDKNFIKISDIAHTAFTNLDTLHNNPGSYTGVKTGFLDVDKMLGGGLRNSDLVILACRPSMGKTAFSLALATKVCKAGQGVAFFSLEMSADQLFERMLAIESKIDFRRIRTGELSADNHESEFAHIGSIIGEIAELPLWIDDTASANILEIRSKARRLKQRHNVGLIIIDYLQLMSGGNDKLYSGNRVQEVSDISRNLKILAKELQVPIIALSQLSRKVESRDDKRPMLSDLRESGSIEQDADIVMFIHREDYYDKTLVAKDDPKAGVADIIIAKNRQGETGFAQVAWNRRLATFDNLHQGKTGHRLNK
jgi:replicative DNA helicase